MNDVVHLYDSVLREYWRSSGMGHTPNIEDAHPWDRALAVSISETCLHIEVHEIAPEDILI